MRMGKTVFVMYGQGGVLTSPGMYALGARIKAAGNNVAYFSARRPDLVEQAIRSFKEKAKVAIIGYSLGANYATWVADAVYPRAIDLVVAYDPTVNAPIKSLRENVKRAICYRQTGYVLTSALFGRGVLVGPQVEIVNTANDHLLVQFDEALHRRTLAAIEEIK